MAVIDEIKQRILQLGSGSFQAMCDQYLSQIGYPNIVSLGTQAGTQKTTQGTPDTYFFDVNGKYIFVEYTTQQRNLPDKIKSDIEKCLDVSNTKIPHDKISEIIYCHTSSNIAPKDDLAFHTMCEKVGIQFTIYGINQLAQELFLKYRSIAKEYLNLAIDSNQIETLEDFIKHYDASKLAAPLSTQFMFREDTLESLGNLFRNTDIVILTGSAGTGKTRLALQYAKSYAQTTNAHLFCIHDNALPIYDDLSLYLEKPGRYILVVDDANQLSGLHHIAKCVTRRADGYDVKILITVRDYAVTKVKDDLVRIAPFEILEIQSLADDQIQQLVKEALGILNTNYLSRISRLAEGNARIAMLAGKLASDANRLDSINDITQLYTAYYSTALVDAGLTQNKTLLATAGIIAFLRTLHIDRVDSLSLIFAQCNLTKEEFIENLYTLHKYEIVDICNDKGVRFAEQCLANYMLKYVFCDTKLIRLSTMIRTCFCVAQEKTVSAVNTLFNVYQVNSIHEYIGKEIKIVWQELSEENSPLFFEYVKAFYPVNPLDTLVMLKNFIDSEKSAIVPIEELDANLKKNHKVIRSDILNILGGFADTDNLESALDLLFEYYQKRPDLFSDFYHVITSRFSISRHANRIRYRTQIKLIEKFCEYSDNWINRYVSELFLAISPVLLGLQFESLESGRGNSVTLYTFSLALSDGVKEYRSHIWRILDKLCMNENYREKIFVILKEYGHYINDCSKPIIYFDSSYIVSIMDTAYPPEQLPNILLAERLSNIISSDEFSFHSLDRYTGSPKLKVYRLLKGPRRNWAEYDVQEKTRREVIEQCIAQCTLTDFINMIDTSKECIVYEGRDSYEIGNGLAIAFHAFSGKGKCVAAAVQHYLKSNTPFNINPIPILRDLFLVLEPSEILSLIETEDFDEKNTWLYAYYHELPIDKIDEMQVDGLYSFLRSTSDATLTQAHLRDVDFLENYHQVDANMLINGSRIILSKTAYSRFSVNLYFSLLFNIHHTSPEITVAKFSSDLELLEGIYIESLSYSHHIDYGGHFLKAIYQARPSILERYVDQVLCEEKMSYHDYDEYKDKNVVFFGFENYCEIFDSIIDTLIVKAQYAMHDVSDFIETIVEPEQNDSALTEKQDLWIRHYITTYCMDSDKMEYLFFGIATLDSNRRIEYFKLFLECNDSFEAFQNLPMSPRSFCWSGSEVPYLSERIHFLESLLPYCVGLKFIKHKQLIYEKIESLREQIRNEEIDDILNN